MLIIYSGGTAEAIYCYVYECNVMGVTDNRLKISASINKGSVMKAIRSNCVDQWALLPGYLNKNSE